MEKPATWLVPPSITPQTAPPGTRPAGQSRVRPDPEYESPGGPHAADKSTFPDSPHSDSRTATGERAKPRTWPVTARAESCLTNQQSRHGLLIRSSSGKGQKIRATFLGFAIGPPG